MRDADQRLLTVELGPRGDRVGGALLVVDAEGNTVGQFSILGFDFALDDYKRFATDVAAALNAANITVPRRCNPADQLSKPVSRARA